MRLTLPQPKERMDNDIDLGVAKHGPQQFAQDAQWRSRIRHLRMKQSERISKELRRNLWGLDVC